MIIIPHTLPTSQNYNSNKNTQKGQYKY